MTVSSKRSTSLRRRISTVVGLIAAATLLAASCSAGDSTPASEGVARVADTAAAVTPSTDVVTTPVVQCDLGPNVDCSNSDLSGRDLTGLVLPGINLSGANLEGALLDGAMLVGADLSGSNLAGASLANTNLTGADLSGAYAPGAVFFQTNMAYANLVRADLTAAVMMDADLRSANMTGALIDGMVDRRIFWCNSIYVNGTLKNDGCQVSADETAAAVTG